MVPKVVSAAILSSSPGVPEMDLVRSLLASLPPPFTRCRACFVLGRRVQTYLLTYLLTGAPRAAARWRTSSFCYRATLCVSAVLLSSGVRPSVPLSVCLLRACIVSRRLKSEKIVKLLFRPGSPHHLSFLTPNAITQFQVKLHHRGR